MLDKKNDNELERCSSLLYEASSPWGREIFNSIITQITSYNMKNANKVL